ncbi:hypothetical protein PCLA_20f0038 [Pseudomonas citronellolis]|nr:hypothetical protein PCLA_20f0038 [Pseudomonas citronellolis]
MSPIADKVRSYARASWNRRSGLRPRFRAQGALLHGNVMSWGGVGADLIREPRLDLWLVRSYRMSERGFS